MKVVFCRWNSICEKGVTNALNRLGIDTVYLDRRFSSVDYDKEYVSALTDLLATEKEAGIVLSINFIPVIARVCNMLHIPYLSWIVDCPCFQLYSETLKYETNRVFCFDRLQYEKFRSINEQGLFYLPLGADVETYDSIHLTKEDHLNYDCDISFIGSLYTEKCQYNGIQDALPDRIKGYCEGLMGAQERVFGYNFLEDAVTEEFALEFKKYAAWPKLGDDYYEDVRGIVADTFLGEKCTEQDRIHTLNALSEDFPVTLYTLSDISPLKGVIFKGGADSTLMMPKIVKCSKINLNMTNKPIRSGLPLRIFDLMAMGGFVISNYQSEIPEYFIPGTDIVLYESISHLKELVSYYLSHEDERLAIAKCGYEKVKLEHSYEVKIQQMLKMVLSN